MSYAAMNTAAATAAAAGAGGLKILPFGNGAERMLNNKIIGAQFHGLDLNMHTTAAHHTSVLRRRALLFLSVTGWILCGENGMHPKVIRAGRANLFLSDVFAQAFVDATNTPVELYNCDGSVGAAVGAGIGAGVYSICESRFQSIQNHCS